jgi:hypothetical protein
MSLLAQKLGILLTSICLSFSSPEIFIETMKNDEFLAFVRVFDETKGSQVSSIVAAIARVGEAKSYRSQAPVN